MSTITTRSTSNHRNPSRLSALLRPASLIKLSVALLLPAMAGCLDASPQWARAHALQDTAASADHALIVAQRHAVPPSPSVAPAAAEPAKAVAVAKAAPVKSAAKLTRETDLTAALGVKRLVVAHGVKAREPVSPAEAFSAEAGRIYAFVEVANPERAESAVFVSFAKDGERERGAVRLRVGESSRWRTWAYTRMAKEPGRYTALVRDGQGKLLAKAPFEVKGSVAPPTDAAPADAAPAPAAPDSPPAAAASKPSPSDDTRAADAAISGKPVAS